MANYKVQGVPLKKLLMLFVSEIEIVDTKTKRKDIIYNSAETVSAHNGFATAVDMLVFAGLT